MSIECKMRIIFIAVTVIIIVAISVYFINSYRRTLSPSIQKAPAHSMQMRYSLGNQLNAIKHEKKGYVIYEYPQLLTASECDDLIAYASNKGLAESDVLDYATSTGTSVNNDYRTSKTAWLRDNEHPVCHKLAVISEQLTGIPKCNQEMSQVAFYESGGKFNEHFDACVFDDVEYCNKMNNGAGQRRSTLLVYLNDDFTGGETVFVDIDIHIKPKKGKAILFWNTDEEERIISESKHRALPVTSGEKWICTKWSHVRAYPS
jgi:prolyl 4-hydroxylase